MDAGGDAALDGGDAADALDDASDANQDGGDGGESNKVVSIAAGVSHTCAAKEDGTLYCWGANSSHQLGLGESDNMSRDVPTLVPGISDVVQVELGNGHSCAVTAAGQLYCWGFNDIGQVGNGSTSTEDQPTPDLVDLADVAQVAVGFAHTCARTHGGLVYCWGFNNAGELGQGNQDTDIHADPLEVSGIDDVIDIGAGNGHTCVVRDGGAVYCWGFNNHSQVGNGDAVNQWSPVQVVGSGATQVALGDRHTCASLTSGTVYCWGRNNQGQLGLDDTTTRTTPTDLQLTDMVSVAAGKYHSCAVQSNGDSLCWGENSEAELGLGHISDYQATPVATAWSATPSMLNMALGYGHSCARDQEGRAACWGFNDIGQVGNDTSGSTAGCVANGGSMECLPVFVINP